MAKNHQPHLYAKSQKYIILVLAAAVLIGAGGELFARYYLRLGTPPLYVEHPTIEYMLRPNQDVNRFGNRVTVNQYGMRSPPFNQTKVGDELRIMVFGDSVLNGGNQTDQAALATTIVQERLSKTKGKVVVGNISAGSWGPGNWLAYAREYGFFDADVVVLVLSSHDYADNPTFEALNEFTHPTRRPTSALVEGITRYLPRYLPSFAGREEAPRSVDVLGYATPPASEAVMRGLADLRAFLILARKRSSQILVFQHFERLELQKQNLPEGHRRIRQLCNAEGVPVISLGPAFDAGIHGGLNPYRDNIHLNSSGQRLLADAIETTLTERGLLQRKP